MTTVHRRRSPVPPRAALRSGAAATRTSVGQRLVGRALDGRHVWGELEVWTSRYGCTSSCLAVYPPGSTRADRIRFRALRSWPPVGMLLGIVVLLVAGHHVPLLAALLLSGAAYASGAAVLALVAGRSRRDIRVLQTCTDDAGVVAFDRGPQHALDECCDRLLSAERSLRDGRIDAVGFERVWGEVWDELGDPSLQRH